MARAKHPSLVTLAGSAQQALGIVDHAAAHVVISEVTLHGHDGWGLIREMRARNVQGARLAAVALAAHAEDPEKVRATGFQACLTKPVDPCQLVASLASQRL